MACASAAVAAAVSSGVLVCEARTRVSTTSVSLQVRCLPRALSLNESVRKVHFLPPNRRSFAIASICVFLFGDVSGVRGSDAVRHFSYLLNGLWTSTFFL